MRRYKIIECQDKHCIIQIKDFLFYKTLQEFDGWDFSDRIFNSYITAKSWVDSDIAKRTIARVTKHP